MLPRITRLPAQRPALTAPARRHLPHWRFCRPTGFWIRAGRQTATATILLKNADPTPYFSVLISRVVSDSSRFVVANPLNNYCLNSHKSVKVTIRFTPDSAGKFNGTLEIDHTDNSSNPTKSYVTLTGTGTGQAVIVPSPSSLNFGQIAVGQSAIRMSF